MTTSEKIKVSFGNVCLSTMELCETCLSGRWTSDEVYSVDNVVED